METPACPHCQAEPRMVEPMLPTFYCRCCSRTFAAAIVTPQPEKKREACDYGGNGMEGGDLGP